MGVCVSKCSSKQPVFKTIINDSFSILTLRNNVQPAFHDPKVKRIQILQAHVKNHTKTLIDHIESNREKLNETIVYIKKTIFTNNNIEYHLVGVFILMEIVFNLPKFKSRSLKHDNNENEEGNATLRLRDYSMASFEHNDGEPIQRIDENVAQFEREFLDLMIHFLDNKYKYRDIMFNYTLNVLLLYSQISNEKISSDKNVQLMKKLIADENFRGKIIEKKFSKNDYKIILDLFTILIHLTVRSSQTATIEILPEYLNLIMHAFNALGKLAESEEIGMMEKEEHKSVSLKGILFDTLDHLSEVAFQINEFGLIINPLFEFFDGISWQCDDLYLEIFMKIIENSRKSKNLDHFEIFLIEKIIDYLTGMDKIRVSMHPGSAHNTEHVESKMNSSSHAKNQSQKKEIKFKKLVCFFCQAIEETNFSEKSEDNEKLKATIHKAFNKFLVKINPFIKNISQMLNGLSTEIYRRTSSSSPNVNSIREIFGLFYMTMEQIEKFPVYSSIPEDLVKNLLKSSEKNDFLIDSFKAVNLIFSAKFSIQENSQMSDHYSPHMATLEGNQNNNMNESGNNNCDTLLNLPFNIFLMVLVEIWKHIKEQRNTTNAKNSPNKEDIQKFLTLYNYFRSIIYSIHLRNEPLFLPVLDSFYVKLLNLFVTDERNSTFNPVLFFILYDQIFIFSKVTNDDSLTNYLTHIREKTSSEAFKKLCEAIETLGENPCYNQTDLPPLSEKILKITIKTQAHFVFAHDSMTACFKEMTSPNSENMQEIPNFDEFILLNDKASKEKFLKEIVTLSNMEFQDLISDHEKHLIKRNSMIITNPKSVSNPEEIQINANYENALQIVKANNMRRKKLEALLDIDNKI